MRDSSSHEDSNSVSKHPSDEPGESEEYDPYLGLPRFPIIGYKPYWLAVASVMAIIVILVVEQVVTVL